MNKANKNWRILALSGSTRKGATSEKILRYVSKTYQQELSVTLYEGLASLPYFNPDLDTSGLPEPVQDFRERIASADGVVICTPEYVFSLPGVLKNAIEWTVSTTVFLNKPVAIIVASGLGEKTFESLALIMQTVGAVVADDAKILIQGSRGKVSQQGDVTDPETIEAIDRLVHSFSKTIGESATIER